MYMKTSVSLNQELSEYVAEISDNAGENDAEAIRDVIRRAHELEDRVEDLEAERISLTAEVESLRAQAEDIQNHVGRVKSIENERDNLRERLNKLESEQQKEQASDEATR